MQVDFHGSFSDSELPSDNFIRQTLQDEPDHFRLAPRQHCAIIVRRLTANIDRRLTSDIVSQSISPFNLSSASEKPQESDRATLPRSQLLVIADRRIGSIAKH